MHSWVSSASESEFSIYNLPLGIFSHGGGSRCVGVAIGNKVVDLMAAYEIGALGKDFSGRVLVRDFLNDYIALGKPTTNRIRKRLQESLCDEHSPLRDSRVLIPRNDVTMHLPVKVGDYTDFYSSLEHATNVGRMFRDPENPLLPNWRHMPVAYHGRSSSIIPSGRDIYRPYGQIKSEGSSPTYGPTQSLDFELELAFIVGRDTRQGEIVATHESEDHIFGLTLFNDWSARDIQKWEYVPLGPFLGKSFASSMSPWIVPIEALEPFRTPGPVQEPPVLPHLQFEGDKNFDIKLSVEVKSEQGERITVCETNASHLYWNMSQQLAHHTSNGCNIRIGDLMASGTISGPEASSYGSLLELTKGGKAAIEKGGMSRTFLEDGDVVTMQGISDSQGIRVGFGPLTTKILPAMM